MPSAFTVAVSASGETMAERLRMGDGDRGEVTASQSWGTASPVVDGRSQEGEVTLLPSAAPRWRGVGVGVVEYVLARRLAVGPGKWSLSPGKCYCGFGENGGRWRKRDGGITVAGDRLAGRGWERAREVAVAPQQLAREREGAIAGWKGGRELGFGVCLYIDGG